MEEASTLTKSPVKTSGSQKSRAQFLSVLWRHIESCKIDRNEKVLVVGGSRQDAELLLRAGFKNITISSFNPEFEEYTDLREKVKLLRIDAEQISLQDGSFDCVFAHEVLHHCRSPHKALCEMLRVARRHVVLLEPNDSFAMRALTRAGFSFPYEIFSVVYHDHECGGVRDSCIPNFIYRWNKNEVHKTVSSYFAEYKFLVHAYPYWDFNIDHEELSRRTETRISAITSFIGAKRFLAGLRITQVVLNLIPMVRKQGNKFFCCIEKSGDLRQWLTGGPGKIAFNPGFRVFP